MTTWELVQTWPCDYAAIERPSEKTAKATAVTKHLKYRPPTTISVHLESCRKCAAMKNLLEQDEKLRRFASRTYGEFVETFKQHGAEDMSAAEFQATKEHAQYVREEILGTANAGT